MQNSEERPWQVGYSRLSYQLKTVPKSLADGLRRWKTPLSTVQSGVTLLALVAGGIFAMFEYNVHTESRRRDATIDLVSEYYRPENYKAREKMEAAWRKNYDVFVEEMSDIDNREVNFKNFVVALVEQAGTEPDLVRLFSFYERVARCHYGNVCDQELNRLYFSESGKLAFTKYHPIICKLRKESTDPYLLVETEKYFLKHDKKACL